MFQLQLQQNHLQNQPWKVVNYCLEPFTNYVFTIYVIAKKFTLGTVYLNCSPINCFYGFPCGKMYASQITSCLCQTVLCK